MARKAKAYVGKEIPRALPHAVSFDPGDETERNFRYQHAYGVMILVAVRRGAKSYNAIYCEHHEDFLCERSDGLFDAYQIKTSRPELGAWTLRDEQLVNSIGRFVELVDAYSSQIGQLYFVSNAEIDSVTPQSTDDRRRSFCPGLFLAHIKSCSTVDEIEEPFRNAFNTLVAELACNENTLLKVLNHLDIIKGPSREDFDATLANEHLGALSECAQMNTAQLNVLRDELVALFHRAASLHVNNPDRHLYGIFSSQISDPVVAAKRIICSNVQVGLPQHCQANFRYLGEPNIQIGADRSPRILEQKLTRGGLTEVIDYMKERETAAEYAFLVDQAKDAKAAAKLLRQIEGAVHGECLEAYMAAKLTAAPFGPKMFNDVTDRLRRLAEDRRDLIDQRPYEILMGTAALLTSACRVWWSERFRLGEDTE